MPSSSSGGELSRPAGNGYHQAGWQDRTSAPAPDVEAEADDQLMSLPEECDAHLSHSHQNNSQDIPATGAPPAPMQVQAPPLHDTSQFSRLDPNRRSFSSPAVNLLVQQQQQHLLAGQCRRSCVRQIQTGSAPEAGSPECGRKQKQRRRTALGLISLGSSHFRPSQLVASSCGQTVAQHQIPATRQATSWRTWFTIGGSMTSSSGQANKQPRKFLLRNLKPRASTTVRDSAYLTSSLAASELASQSSLASDTPADAERPTGTDNASYNRSTANHVDELQLGCTQLSAGGQLHLARADTNPTATRQPSQSANEIGETQADGQESAHSSAESSQHQFEVERSQTQVANKDAHLSSSSQANISPEKTQREADLVTMRPPEAHRPGSLVDRLVDSELDWRTLIKQVNEHLTDWSLDQVGELQIKRQEVIHELIQTERHHCLTLALMRQVYLAGLRQLNESRSLRENQSHQASKPGSQVSAANRLALVASGQQVDLVNQNDQIDLDRLFPALEDLIQAHELFFAYLRLKLVDSCQDQLDDKPVGLVGSLGDLLRDQFSLDSCQEGARSDREGDVLAGSDSSKSRLCCKPSSTVSNGQKLLQAYAKFCGQHYDSSRYYKHLMASDKGFRQFIENPACRQRGIPECNLLVTQRLTKYPLLIEQLIKTSKDDQDEESKLKEALRECRRLLAELNSQLARKESFERLLDIYAQFCPKSYTIYNRHLRFTKHDLLQHKRLRQLLHSDGQIRIWSATRRKLFQVLCLILNDIVVFLRIEPASPSSATSSAPSGIAPGSLQVALPAAVVANTQSGSSLSPSSPGTGCQVAPNLHLAGAGGAFDELSRLEQSHYSIKYYFANIDNKSSVISLGKLLVREKAVNDNEPRIYMISSSPRQPEMYELAFVSKRHQTSFVDKLKASIEQYNKSTDLLDEQLEDYDDDLEELAALAACERVDLEEQTLDDDDQDDCGSFSIDCKRRNCLFDSDDELDVGFEDVALDQAQSNNVTDQPEQSEPQREQDLKPTSDSQQQSSTLAIDGNAHSSTLSRSCSDAPDSGNSLLTVSAGSTSDNEASSSASRPADESLITESGLSERAKDSMDEDTSSSRQKLRSTRRRRLQRPRNVSNQSSSSEEATAHRQALELISNSTSTRVCKLADGPKGISASVHGSTGSGQQTKLSAGEDEFDSGRGQDDYSSAASISSNSIESRMARVETQSLANSESVDVQAQSTGGSSSSPDTSTCERDSKKRSTLTNKSLSTSSIVSSLTANEKQASADYDPAGNPQVSQEQAAFAANKQPVTAHSSLSKCSFILSSTKSKACSLSISKQRKLSTVSTMSSQLKLLNKLRSSGLLGSGQVGQSTFCPQCCYLLPSRSNSLVTTTANDTTNNSDNYSQQEQLERQQQQLSTLSKQMRQQIRRSSFVPEQKLEELRDLRIQLDKDKQEWQLKFDRMQEQLLNERRELDLAREKLKQDRQQVANEREQLYRKLDVLKEKGILLSPSHKVIITSPELRLYGSSQPSPRHVEYQHQPVYYGQHQQSMFKLTNHANHRHQVVHTKCIPQSNHLVEIQNSHNMAANYSNASSLHLHGSPKVPLHLSQQGPMTNQSTKQPLSFGAYKVPLISSLSGGFLGNRSSSSKISETNHTSRDPKAMSHAV